MPTKPPPGLTVARKPHLCAFCDTWIHKGEAHVAWVILPSQHPDCETPWRGHAHEACNAFWCDRVGPEWGDEVPVDWDEAMREFDWDGWLAQRDGAAAVGGVGGTTKQEETR